MLQEKTCSISSNGKMKRKRCIAKKKTKIKKTNEINNTEDKEVAKILNFNCKILNNN